MVLVPVSGEFRAVFRSRVQYYEDKVGLSRKLENIRQARISQRSSVSLGQATNLDRVKLCLCHLGSQAMVKDDVAVVLLAIMLIVMYKTYGLYA